MKQALHNAAKRYPGGIRAIAALCGVNAHTLQNKINPSQPGCVNIEEFAVVLKCTRSSRVLDAIGQMARCEWIDLGQFDECSERELRAAARDLLKRIGALSRKLRPVLAADGAAQDELEELQRVSRQLAAVSRMLEPRQAASMTGRGDSAPG